MPQNTPIPAARSQSQSRAWKTKRPSPFATMASASPRTSCRSCSKCSFRHTSPWTVPRAVSVSALSVTKQLVALHGGRVEGSSEGLGKGSEFSVHLPIASEADGHPAPKQSQAPADPSSTNRHRVLVVDDNTDTADAVAETA